MLLSFMAQFISIIYVILIKFLSKKITTKIVPPKKLSNLWFVLWKRQIVGVKAN